MPNYLKADVLLVMYPFSNLASAKIRPAVVVNANHVSQDLLIVPLTSKTGGLLAGEFVLADWRQAGLNIETAVKRGLFTVEQSLVRKRIGKLEEADANGLEHSLREWLDLPQQSLRHNRPEILFHFCLS